MVRLRRLLRNPGPLQKRAAEQADRVALQGAPLVAESKPGNQVAGAGGCRKRRPPFAWQRLPASWMPTGNHASSPGFAWYRWCAIRYMPKLHLAWSVLCSVNTPQGSNGTSKIRRKALGLTQEALAEKVGTVSTYIAMIERLAKVLKLGQRSRK